MNTISVHVDLNRVDDFIEVLESYNTKLEISTSRIVMHHKPTDGKTLQFNLDIETYTYINTLWDEVG